MTWQGRAPRPADAQAAVGPDRLRGRHRRRLRRRHAGLHGHDRRVVQEPLRAHAAGRRRRGRGRARRSRPTSRCRRRCRADTLEKVKSVAGRRRRRGQRQLRRHAARQAGRADRLQRPADAADLGVTGEDLPGPRLRRAARRPQTDDEVAIDRGTAKKFDFKVGDTVTVSGAAPAKQFTVSGIATLGGQDSLGGARLVVFTLPRGAADHRPRRLRLDLGLDRRRRPGRRSRPRSSASSGATSWSARARRRPSSRPRTSPTRSASSASRCWSSRASRCSSAAS